VLSDYREHRASAAEVASAFVAARITAHSPSFSRDTADPDRLLEMVAACSTEPVFERTDAGSVAEQLGRTQDEQREQLKKIGTQLGRGMQSKLAAMNQLSGGIAGLVRSLGLQNAAIVEAMSRVTKASGPVGLERWIAAMPQLQPQPALSQWFKGMASVPSPSILRMSTLNVKQFGVSDLSNVLKGIRTAYPAVGIPAVLQRFAGRQELGIGEILGAARSAASLAGALGDSQSAEVLSEATAEAEAVLEKPELERIRESVDHLVDVVKQNEQRRRSDRRADRNEDLFLWVVTILLAIYIGLWPYLVRP